MKFDLFERGGVLNGMALSLHILLNTASPLPCALLLTRQPHATRFAAKRPGVFAKQGEYLPSSFYKKGQLFVHPRGLSKRVKRFKGGSPYPLIFVRGFAIIGGSTPQNVDLPASIPKTKKKPFLTPPRRGGRMKKIRKRKALQPPANGLLVPELIPVAKKVLGARATLIHGVTELMKVIPVKACRFCSEVHVGPVGHLLATCTGPKNSMRKSRHEWTSGSIDDVVVQLDVYHLADRLGTIVRHENRFDVERIPAVVELCIQAGINIPGYPTRRRSQPVHMVGRKIVEFDDSELQEVDEGIDDEFEDNVYEEMHDSINSVLLPESNDVVKVEFPISDVPALAEKTMQAWDVMCGGAKMLMRKYPVRVCGYCPEVHVGPRGHKVKVCGAYKHQWRAGQHGWQEASIDDLIPPKYVWHVKEPDGPPLVNELKKYYGQAPAVVELCVQAGAAVSDRYRAMMRLDVVIPDIDEVEKVA